MIGRCARYKSPIPRRTPARSASGRSRALDGTQDYIAENNKMFTRRRQSGGGHALNENRRVICPKPEGAFYVYPSSQGL